MILESPRWVRAALTSVSTNTPEFLADLRTAAVRVVRELVAAGHVAYFAGGCVRDRLMGIDPTDYDVATSARPEQVAELFRGVQAVGVSFGVMLVRIRGSVGYHVIQVATFRTDGVYSDGRHPESVEFSDAKHDASRRDFTINGLFEDPLKDEVIDYVGGRDDLQARIVRAIGDPFARIREDHLRMLRAVRFAARFAFTLESDTAAAVASCANDLRGVSRERIGQELRRMFGDRNRAVAAWETQYLGLDAGVLDEPHSLKAPVRVGRLPNEVPFATALAAWLLDRHEAAVAMEDWWLPVVGRWHAALVLSNDERADLEACLRAYEALRRGTWNSVGVAAQKRLAASRGFLEGAALLQTVDRPAFVDVCRRLEQLRQTGLAPEPLITGDDLIRLGMTPGKLFKRVLDSVYDAQLEGSVTLRDEALSLARVLAGEGV